MEIREFQSFAELIKALRFHFQLSQRALAKALEVSPGYVGQWELQMSQPSVEVMVRLCQKFNIDDIEFVQRLVYAQRAPEWLRESIIHYRGGTGEGESLSSTERRVVKAMRKLERDDTVRLTERIEGWVDALTAP
jgi:transcriptional regulator with XRE-family HTH domain